MGAGCGGRGGLERLEREDEEREEDALTAPPLAPLDPSVPYPVKATCPARRRTRSSYRERKKRDGIQQRQESEKGLSDRKCRG